MARRLFKRIILMFGVLTMLVIPTGQASGQEDPLHDGELEGVVTASNVVSPCPDPMDPTHHCREEGVFQEASIDLVARRAGEEGRRHELQCRAAGEGTDVPFRGRQNLLQGRGFIGGGPHIPLPGILFRDNNDDDDFLDEGEITQVICRVRVEEGIFHRVGTIAYGRITVDVHTSDNAGSDPFRHVYCARFEASAIPTPPVGTAVTAVATGRISCNDDPLDALHEVGRTPDDDNDHG